MTAVSDQLMAYENKTHMHGRVINHVAYTDKSA